MRIAGAAGVLQQLGDERETVGESVALVAERAFLVDSNLYLHDVLHECRRHPAPAGRTRQGKERSVSRRGGPVVKQLPGGQASIRLCPRNSQGQQVLGAQDPALVHRAARPSGRSDANAPGRPASRRRR